MTLLLTAILAASEPAALAGTVQVGRGVQEPIVWLLTSTGSQRLAGEPTVELRRLQSARVEVLGVAEPERFHVRAYRILELAGGKRPIAVGVLRPSGLDLGLVTDAGAPIPLSASPGLRAALTAHPGAKVWVLGEKLLSGEIKVTRFGVLREPTPPEDEDVPPPPATDSGPGK